MNTFCSFVTRWQLIAFYYSLNILMFSEVVCSQKQCPLFHAGDVITAQDIHKASKMLCSGNHSDVQVYRILQPNSENSTITHTVIYKPASIPNCTFLFLGSVQRLRVLQTSAEMTSCRRKRDTVSLITSRYNPKPACVSVIVALKHPLSVLGRLITTYSDHTRNYEVLFKERNTIERRSIKDGATQLEENKISINTTDKSECGKSRGCFRYKETGDRCGHFECTYFLSYVLDYPNLDIEISGRSPGWVAIGFSSDRFMGGEDIFACIREGRGDKPLTVRSYKTEARYTQPIQQKYHSKVDATAEQNGYIYCRFSMSVTKSEDDYHDVDLTNEWYQLYARGDIAENGEMAKHTTIPLVSKSKTSLIRKVDIFTNDSDFLSSYNILILFCVILLR